MNTAGRGVFSDAAHGTRSGQDPAGPLKGALFCRDSKNGP